MPSVRSLCSAGRAVHSDGVQFGAIQRVWCGSVMCRAGAATCPASRPMQWGRSYAVHVGRRRCGSVLCGRASSAYAAVCGLVQVGASRAAGHMALRVGCALCRLVVPRGSSNAYVVACRSVRLVRFSCVSDAVRQCVQRGSVRGSALSRAERVVCLSALSPAGPASYRTGRVRSAMALESHESHRLPLCGRMSKRVHSSTVGRHPQVGCAGSGR